MSNDSTPGSRPSNAGEFPGAGDGLDRNAAFGVLSHAYRRCGLSYLLAAHDWVPVDDLYGHVADQEVAGRSGDETEARRRVEVAFHHWHRPMLEDEELIEFDEGDGSVRATENAADLDTLLEPTA